MEIRGFKVGGSEKSVHFVAGQDAATIGIRGLYLPLSKACFVESDESSIEIQCATGTHIGFPGVVTIDDSFATKIGLTV